MGGMDRRTFVKGAAMAAAGAALMPRFALAEGNPPAAELIVVHGTDPGKMLAAGIRPRAWRRTAGRYIAS